MKKIMKNKNKGFTIVELIVVMAIIAILILIAVPTFTKYIDNANKTSEMANGDTIYKAAMAAVVEDYVTAGDTAIADLTNNIKAGVDGTVKLQVETFTSAAFTVPAKTNLPPADTWGVYIHSSSSDGKTVDATSKIYMIAPVNGETKRNVYTNGNIDTTLGPIDVK